MMLMCTGKTWNISYIPAALVARKAIKGPEYYQINSPCTSWKITSLALKVFCLWTFAWRPSKDLFLKLWFTTIPIVGACFFGINVVGLCLHKMSKFLCYCFVINSTTSVHLGHHQIKINSTLLKATQSNLS